jgi:hypothetical protein
MISRYTFEEGSIDLPDGFHDRSTNIFVFGKGNPSPSNLNIARDVLLPDENLVAYVDRQIGMLKKNLRAYTFHQRQVAALGRGESALLGEQIASTHRNGNQTIHQRQAAFIRGGGSVLILSWSSVFPFGDEQDRVWTDWLASYQTRHES